MVKSKAAVKSIVRDIAKSSGSSNLLSKLEKQRSPEFIFAVVGYAGSGTSKVARQLETLLSKKDISVEIIKARTSLDDYAKKAGGILPSKGDSKIEQVTKYQDLGDNARESSGENSTVTAYMIKRIKEIREKDDSNDETKVFIIDSIKHPAEVKLLHHVYGVHFCLIGVGCRPDIRATRLYRKLELDPDKDESTLAAFINRDNEDSEHDHGQKVSDTFHLSHYFVDNTPSDESDLYLLPDKLKRLVDLLFDGIIHRPEQDERGLYHAHASSLRSSCLSRQVGAAIIDNRGDLLSVGTNDVPRAGGGLYCNEDDNDDRCFKNREECSNTVKQNEIVQDLLKRLKNNGIVSDDVNGELFKKAVGGSRIGALIEFSRSVHAEMDALMTLVRDGVKLGDNASLYSTTYPCHNCARHIVASGIKRVVYLEPYAKSLAINLHDDSIADNLSSTESEGMVVFVPYQGVSPRFYNRIFNKTGDLKDKKTGEMLNSNKVEYHRSALFVKSYLDMEQEVVDFLEEFEKGNASSE